MPLQDWGLFDRVITEPVTEPVVPRPRVEDAVPAAAAPAATAGARIGAFGNFMNLFGQMSTQNGGASGETQAAEQITSDLIKSGGMKITPVFISEPRGLLGLSKWYFPFSPIINTNFSTNYSSYNMTHSNYQQMAFDSSENAQLSIIGNVTARDEAEAEFILAGYCFFRGAMKMFWEKNNYTAGGRKVELVIADTTCNPDQALTQARRLALQEKVNFLLG